MKKIIHNLRSQPEETRKHILHATTFILAVLLLLAWVYMLGTGLSSDETEAEIKEDLEPLSAMRDNFVNGYESLNDTE